MKLLSAVHRWTGGFIGLLLAILGLTGAILVWKDDWIALTGAHDPLRENVPVMARIVEQAATTAKLSRVTFASDQFGLHQLVNADGSGAYVRQNGAVAGRWTSQWQRPELWLFDLHHRLFAGATGETLTGIAGMVGLGFVLTGAILWWRGRARFRPTLLPKRLAPGPIVKHHRDVGLLLVPLLTVSFLTGVLMVFAPIRTAVMGGEERPKHILVGRQRVDAANALVRAKAIFPQANVRRITLPATANSPIVVRMRQPFEWTPNGRTQITFEADGDVTVEDARFANGPASLAEKLYPLHTAKVGGLVMKLLMTLSGFGLFVLGILGAYSFFWARRSSKKRRRRFARSLARA